MSDYIQLQYHSCSSRRKRFTFVFPQGYTCHDEPLSCHPFTSAGLLSDLLLASPRKPVALNFQRHIRGYNAAMAFASFTDSHSINTRNSDNSSHATSDSAMLGAPPVYILHGRPYHMVSTLCPNDPERKRSFAQLHVLDPHDAAVSRSSSFDELDVNLLKGLHDFLIEPVLHKDILTGQVSSTPQKGNPCFSARNP